MPDNISNYKLNRFFWFHSIGIFILLLLSIMTGMILGSADLSFADVLNVIKFKLLGIETAGLQKSVIYIVWEMRLPRVLLAIAVGGGLAICGAAMQALTQNVLAEPYILGVSSGASAMISIFYFSGGVYAGLSLGTQFFAFSGAIIALILVYAVGMSGGTRSSSTRLVLAGMAVSIILNAVSQLFMSLSSSATTRNIALWMMGSLAGARHENIVIPLIGSFSGLLFFVFNSRSFNLFSLGDESAICLGLNINIMKKITILVVALITGISVAAGGIIGLIGFIVPHLARFIGGTEHRKLFPLSFLIGGVFLLWMDVLARTLMSPQELPVGVFTALCGGPIFVYHLWIRSKK